MPGGNIYFGQHKEFLKEGLGKMMFYNNPKGETQYEGSWENDKRNGKGKLVYRLKEN